MVLGGAGLVVLGLIPRIWGAGFDLSKFTEEWYKTLASMAISLLQLFFAAMVLEGILQRHRRLELTSRALEVVRRIRSELLDQSDTTLRYLEGNQPLTNEERDAIARHLRRHAAALDGLQEHDSPIVTAMATIGDEVARAAEALGREGFASRNRETIATLRNIGEVIRRSQDDDRLQATLSRART